MLLPWTVARAAGLGALLGSAARDKKATMIAATAGAAIFGGVIGAAPVYAVMSSKLQKDKKKKRQKEAAFFAALAEQEARIAAAEKAEQERLQRLALMKRQASNMTRNAMTLVHAARIRGNDENEAKRLFFQIQDHGFAVARQVDPGMAERALARMQAAHERLKEVSS